MRAHGWIGALLCISGAAAADTAKPAAGDSLDISSYKAELIVLSDDDGTMYVLRPRTNLNDGIAFVGDGKVFYQQYLTGGSVDGIHKTWGYGIWAPRVPGHDDALIHLDKDWKYHLSCGTEKALELRPLGKKEADRILDGAAFRPRLWSRRSHLLARDNDGVYYFVDRDIDANESLHHTGDRRYEHGHRVFVGKKSAMKELPMSNVVADSAGEIYQTKRGDLRIVMNNADRSAVWVRGKKQTPLTLLDPGNNRYLIFRQLGVYGFMGTACEDL